MNCPTRDPEPKGRIGFNQSPSSLDKDLVPSASMSNPLHNGASNNINPDDVSMDLATQQQQLQQDLNSDYNFISDSSRNHLIQDNCKSGLSSLEPTMPESSNDSIYHTNPFAESGNNSGDTPTIGATSRRTSAATNNNDNNNNNHDCANKSDYELGSLKKAGRRRSSQFANKFGSSTITTCSSGKEMPHGSTPDNSRSHKFRSSVELIRDVYLPQADDSTASSSTLADDTYDANGGTGSISNENDDVLSTTGSEDSTHLLTGANVSNNDVRRHRRRGTGHSSHTSHLYVRQSLSSGNLKEKIDAIVHISYKAMLKYAKFVGPGIMVSVAYLDPGNYATAVSAGALYQYKHLFVVLLSNLFAVFLQILCTKLGGVTGLDLAQNCREHLPRSLCIVIYALAEITIIATDLAEVVGTAIALNILLNIPLTLGVVLTVLDVLLVLMAYRPNGPIRLVRYFEYMVSALVFVVVICFAVELSEIRPSDTGAIFRGFLPSKELIESQGLYLSCGILGATVMPHSLYLGSGLVQPRLREYDSKHGHMRRNSVPSDYRDINDPSPVGNGSDTSSVSSEIYKPSIHAIKYAMNFSIAELVISLFTVAIFVNSAILIVAGSTLANSPESVDADLFSIYAMLTKYLGKAAGYAFALALLFSGQSAGIVCTLAGQIVSEGFLHWSFQPWIRRIITRAIAIAPCLFVTMFVGRKGLANVLNASQVVLSLLLPFVSAPLLYFTCNKRIMRVPTSTSTATTTNNSDICDEPYSPEYIDMSNSTLTNVLAVLIFVFISGLNCFLVFSMAG